jgi:hypothetical protein
MKKFIENIINETFASKAQQKYFYSRANDKTLPKKERKKWSKMADEFSEKTNFKKLPEKVKNDDLDEMVDEFGEIINGHVPINKQITSNSTTDEFSVTGNRQMGTTGSYGVRGLNMIPALSENDLSNALGYQNTMAQNMPYKKAKLYFKKELELEPDEINDRMKQIGYDKKLEKPKVRLIEKAVDNAINEYKINPIVLKQIKSLKESIKNNNVPIENVYNLLKK